MSCKGKTGCRGFAMASGYCWGHDPARADERQRAVVRRQDRARSRHQIMREAVGGFGSSWEQRARRAEDLGAARALLGLAFRQIA